MKKFLLPCFVGCSSLELLTWGMRSYSSAEEAVEVKNNQQGRIR